MGAAQDWPPPRKRCALDTGRNGAPGDPPNDAIACLTFSPYPAPQCLYMHMYEARLSLASSVGFSSRLSTIPLPRTGLARWPGPPWTCPVRMCVLIRGPWHGLSLWRAVISAVMPPVFAWNFREPSRQAWKNGRRRFCARNFRKNFRMVTASPGTNNHQDDLNGASLTGFRDIIAWSPSKRPIE